VRAPAEAAATRAEISRRDQKRQSEALLRRPAEYRLSPAARYVRLAVSGEVNRMIAAINVDPKWFWYGPDVTPCPVKGKSPGS
jgi:hypothetical protein